MRRMILGYNTNGFAHHRFEDTLAILAELGYRGVAITLDHHVLNPFAADLDRQIRETRDLLRKLDLRCVVETGSRFLLDPWRKHQPTLVSPSNLERNKRLHFLRMACDIAQELGADCVSFWSGTPDDDAGPEAWLDRLAEGYISLCDYAAEQDVRLAFEPEPGMFVDTMAKFAELRERVRHPNFGLTIDVGHVHCVGEDLATTVAQSRDCLFNVHLDDMKQGNHDHLMFGDGDIDFASVMAALRSIDYAHGAYVELSRHSHDAVNTARKSLEFLRKHA